MLEAYTIDTSQHADNALEVLLTYEQRKKSRYKCSTVCGKSIGWFLQRGHVLADGEYLVCEDGSKIKVIAAPEPVSDVRCSDPLQLTRAAYHLGNRHVPLQIGADFLRYQHDHVLDDMVRGLGLKVSFGEHPFHPESGAYHTHSAVHSDTHTHDHHH